MSIRLEAVCETIEMRLPKYGFFLALTEEEVYRLLTFDVDVWARGLDRGQAVLRARAAEDRASRTAQETTFSGGTTCDPCAKPNEMSPLGWKCS